MKAGASPPALAARRQGPVRARRRGWGAPSKGAPPASVGASSPRSAQAATWARATAPACPFIVCLSAFFSGGCMKAGASPPAMAARRQGPVRARRRGWGGAQQRSLARERRARHSKKPSQRNSMSKNGVPVTATRNYVSTNGGLAECGVQNRGSN